MNVGETDPHKRVLQVALFTLAGGPLPGNHDFSGDTIKYIKPDGTVVAITGAPTVVAGAPIVNTFRVPVLVTDIAMAGRQEWQWFGPDLKAGNWIEDIGDAADVWRTTRAGNQPVGSFGEILDARVSAIVAQHVAATVAPSKPYSLIAGDLEPDMPLVAVELDGTPANLSTAQSVQLRWSKPGVAAALVALVAVDLVTGQMKRVWGAADTDIVGTHRGQMVVMTANGETTTYPRDGTHYSWVVYPRIA